jgi:hypothetical protein
MNCEHHTANRPTGNELICTACSPRTSCEQPANNPDQPMKSGSLRNWPEKLFTGFSPEILRCGKVCVFKKRKAGA